MPQLGDVMNQRLGQLAPEEMAILDQIIKVPGVAQVLLKVLPELEPVIMGIVQGGQPPQPGGGMPPPQPGPAPMQGPAPGGLSGIPQGNAVRR